MSLPRQHATSGGTTHTGIIAAPTSTEASPHEPKIEVASSGMSLPRQHATSGGMGPLQAETLIGAEEAAEIATAGCASQLQGASSSLAGTCAVATPSEAPNRPLTLSEAEMPVEEHAATFELSTPEAVCTEPQAAREPLQLSAAGADRQAKADLHTAPTAVAKADAVAHWRELLLRDGKLVQPKRWPVPTEPTTSPTIPLKPAAAVAIIGESLGQLQQAVRAADAIVSSVVVLDSDDEGMLTANTGRSCKPMLADTAESVHAARQALLTSKPPMVLVGTSAAQGNPAATDATLAESWLSHLVQDRHPLILACTREPRSCTDSLKQSLQSATVGGYHVSHCSLAGTEVKQPLQQRYHVTMLAYGGDAVRQALAAAALAVEGGKHTGAPANMRDCLGVSKGCMYVPPRAQHSKQLHSSTSAAPTLSMRVLMATLQLSCETASGTSVKLGPTRAADEGTAAEAEQLTFADCAKLLGVPGLVVAPGLSRSKLCTMLSRVTPVAVVTYVLQQLMRPELLRTSAAAATYNAEMDEPASTGTGSCMVDALYSELADDSTAMLLTDLRQSELTEDRNTATCSTAEPTAAPDDCPTKLTWGEAYDKALQICEQKGLLSTATEHTSATSSIDCGDPPASVNSADTLMLATTEGYDPARAATVKASAKTVNAVASGALKTVPAQWKATLAPGVYMLVPTEPTVVGASLVTVEQGQRTLELPLLFTDFKQKVRRGQTLAHLHRLSAQRWHQQRVAQAAWLHDPDAVDGATTAEGDMSSDDEVDSESSDDDDMTCYSRPLGHASACDPPDPGKSQHIDVFTSHCSLSEGDATSGQATKAASFVDTSTTYTPILAGAATKAQPATAATDSDTDPAEDPPALTAEQVQLLAVFNRHETQHLSAAQQQQLDDILVRMAQEGAFSFNGELGKVTAVRHHIDVGDCKPKRARMRKYSVMELEVLWQEVDKLLKLGVIEPSTSPWNSPLLLVPKPDGKLRVVQDLRAVNQAVKEHGNGQDGYPLPRIDELLGALHGACWFSSMDALSGFWHVELDKESRPYTAFQTKWGHYQWTVGPMGIMNMPATFQRLMQLTMGHDALWVYALVYIDDVLVFSSSFQQHMQHLESVLSRLAEAGIKLKPSKCHFAQRQLRFLGHVVDAVGRRTDPSKVKAIDAIAEPTDVAAVRSFLQMASYYRQYIKDFATITEPLNKLLRKGVAFEFNDDCRAAWFMLKLSLKTSPVLVHPDIDGIRSGKCKLVVQSDASDVGIGAVLSQVTDDQEHPLSYYSRSLRPAERNYGTYDREALAAVEAVQYFRPYLHNGNAFLLQTDHAALAHLLSPSSELNNKRQERYVSILQGYNMDIKYRPGAANGNADALSRLRNGVLTTVRDDTAAAAVTEGDDGDLATSSRWTADSFSKAQRDDADLAPVMKYLQSGQLSGHTAEQRAELLAQVKRGSYYLRHGLLYKTISGSRKQHHGDDLVVVPAALTDAVLADCHEATMGGGHVGFARTYAKVKQRYHWANMYSDTLQWVLRCATCQSRKLTQLAGVPIYGFGHEHLQHPFEMLGLDVVGPFPTTADGNKYLIVFTDYLTRWVEAFATPDHTAQRVAGLIVDAIISRHGCPAVLLTDNGPEFRGQLLAALTTLLSTNQRFTSPYHPQCNGLTERANGTVVRLLSMMVAARQHDWDRCLPQVLFTHRASVNRTLGYSPFYMLYGREPVLPLQCMLQDSAACPKKWSHVQDYIDDVHERLKVAHDMAVDFYEQQQQLREDAALTPAAEAKRYAEGDLVWVHYFKRRKGLSPKLDGKHWFGPYQVVRRMAALDTYVLREVNGPTGAPTMSTPYVHATRLRPYRARPDYGAPEVSPQPASLPAVQPYATITVDDGPNAGSVLAVGQDISVREDYWADGTGKTGTVKAIIVYIDKRSRLLHVICESSFLDTAAFRATLPQFLAAYKGKKVPHWGDFLAQLTRVPVDSEAIVRI